MKEDYLSEYVEVDYTIADIEELRDVVGVLATDKDKKAIYVSREKSAEAFLAEGFKEVTESQ